MSRHHKASKWTTVSTALRKRIQPMLPLPCARCGIDIEPDEPWDLGHVTDLALSEGDHSQVRPEHRRCNRRSGGRLGARISNAKRQQKRSEPNW